MYACNNLNNNNNNDNPGGHDIFPRMLVLNGLHAEVVGVFLKNPVEMEMWVSVLVLGAAEHPVPMLSGRHYVCLCVASSSLIK